MKKKQQSWLAPAFPPQLMQDNFGQIVAMVPGMTKLEFIAALFLPTAIQLQQKHGQLRHEGEIITPLEACVYYAKDLIQLCEQFQTNDNEKDNLQIIQ
jgi:hypothetical protein